jgi:fatty acid-binding protein DegV
MTLGRIAGNETSLEDLLATIDELEPKCDSIFVPGDLSSMRLSGKLSLIEDRVGGLDDETPLLRVGTRLTGLAKAETFDSAVAEAVRRVGQRPGASTPLNVTIAHASAPERANFVAEQVRGVYPVGQLSITDLAATIGAQLGPGTIGIGVAPAPTEGSE